MSILADFREKAKELYRTVVLPEGEDERTLAAAAEIINEKIADVILLGDAEIISEKLKNIGVSQLCEIRDPKKDPKLQEYAELYYNKRKHKGLTMEEALSSMRENTFFGAMMVHLGEADAAVMGACYTTADVLKAGLRVVGTAGGVKTVSSFFIMVTDKKELGEDGILLFADCAVNPEPTAEMIADIAISTAENCKSLLGIEPKVALLSFSSKGSAKTESTEKMLKALDIIKDRAPDLNVDGELQLDAAIIPAVGARKAPGSSVAGKANVLIFPDLNSGNIGYKLVERFASAQAIGPIIQGFNRPINDLSRGASAQDIVNVVAIASIQVKKD